MSLPVEPRRTLNFLCTGEEPGLYPHDDLYPDWPSGQVGEILPGGPYPGMPLLARDGSNLAASLHDPTR